MPSSPDLAAENALLRRAIVVLHRVATLVQGSPELEPTCYAALTGVTAGVGLGMNRAMLFLTDEDDRSVLRGVAAVGPKDAAEADRVWRDIEAQDLALDALYDAGVARRDEHAALDEAVKAVRVPVDGDTPIAHALRENQVVHGEGSDDLGGLLDPATCVATPLHGRDRLVGVLYADNLFTGTTLSREAELIFALVADHAGRAIDNAHAFERVARQARTDALTGLGHHGAMMESAERLLADGLSVVMLDLDDFKAVNDEHGHLAGDALLVELAERLRHVLRRDAEPFRYGGEEFAVLAAGADAEEGAAIARRIREAVAEHTFRIDGGPALAVTCSVGVATARPGDTTSTLFAAADAALLEAKADGKNQVRQADRAPR